MKNKMKCASAGVTGKVCETCRRLKEKTRECNTCGKFFHPTCSFAFHCFDCFSFNSKVNESCLLTYSIGGR